MLRIGSTAPKQGSNVVLPGSKLLVKMPPGFGVRGSEVPFLLATALETPPSFVGETKVLVQWWWPPVASRENFRGGRKQAVVDIFGAWRPLETIPLEELRGTTLPEPLASAADILECNFALDGEGQIRRP